VRPSGVSEGGGNARVSSRPRVVLELPRRDGREGGGALMLLVCPLHPLLNVLEVQLRNREVARGEVTLVLKKVVGVSLLTIADAGDACMSICIDVVVSGTCFAPACSCD
jgi:hypothetical protein